MATISVEKVTFTLKASAFISVTGAAVVIVFCIGGMRAEKSAEASAAKCDSAVAHVDATATVVDKAVIHIDKRIDELERKTTAIDNTQARIEKKVDEVGAIATRVQTSVNAVGMVASRIQVSASVMSAAVQNNDEKFRAVSARFDGVDARIDSVQTFKSAWASGDKTMITAINTATAAPR